MLEPNDGNRRQVQRPLDKYPIHQIQLRVLLKISQDASLTGNRRQVQRPQRLFFPEFGADQEALLVHIEVRWFSMGNVVLCRRKRISPNSLTASAASRNSLNSANKSRQGRFATVIFFVDNVHAFFMKLELVGRQNQGRTLQHV